MGWFERAKNASAGRRVTRSDNQHAIDVAELNALNADRERLMREGLRGIATIVAIHENVTTTLLGSWHELELDVQPPDRDVYRTTRRISLELSSAPHIKMGGDVPVRVDPGDLSKVLVVATL